MADDRSLRAVGPMSKKASVATAPAFSLCVYCGSRDGESPDFTAAAEACGRWIGTHGGCLVYGGGRAGLMGVVADATLAAGGQVVGVIPQSLVDRELAHGGCTELHIVQTMHERKRIMADRADAFLALPGGIGTMEELFEAWTWRQLGYHHKPVGLLNVQGYFDALLVFLDHARRQGFMGQSQMDLLRTDYELQRMLPALVQEAGLVQPGRMDRI